MSVLKQFFVALTISFLAMNCHGQAYPSKPIVVIVTYPPGAGGDILVRLLGQKLAESGNQQLIVLNRPGGNTVIGVEQAAKAAPDGYTFLMGQTQSLSIVPSMYSKLAYDVDKDFIPTLLVGHAPLLLVVNLSLPVKSVRELISFAKEKKNGLKFSSSGMGGTTHLAGELFKSMTGVDMLHIPYQGGGTPLMALLSSEVDLAFEGIVQALPYVKSGKLRLLAIATTRRSEVIPDIPTVSESGLTGFDVAPWFGFVAPKGTARDSITRFHGLITKIISQADTKDQIAKMGIETANMSPEEFGEYLVGERAKWARAIKQSGAKLE